MRADPTIAQEAGAALAEGASSGSRLAGVIHAAGAQVHALAEFVCVFFHLLARCLNLIATAMSAGNRLVKTCVMQRTGWEVASGF